MKIFYTPNELVGGRQHFRNSFLWQFAFVSLFAALFHFILLYVFVFSQRFFFWVFLQRVVGYARS